MRVRLGIWALILWGVAGAAYAQQDARLLKAQEKIDKLQRKVEQLTRGVQRADSVVEVARGLTRAAEDSLRMLVAEEQSIRKAQFEAEKRARKDVNEATENTVDSLRIEYQNIEKEIDMRMRDLDRRGRSAQRCYENGVKGEKRAKALAKRAYEERKNAEKAVAQAQADYVKLEKSLKEKKQKAEQKAQKRENDKQKHKRGGDKKNDTSGL